MSYIIVGIDASRNRSGGAKAHLIGILEEANPASFGISTVHLWSYKSLLDQIPDFPWLVKHNPDQLEKSLARQVWWQYYHLPKEATKAGCHVMLNTDAGTISQFRPSVVMSRDMLSYEKGEMQRYGWTKARLRLLALKYIQARSLKQANGAIFLTRYAASTIQKFTGQLRKTAIIPHGVSHHFRRVSSIGTWLNDSIRCLYVSNAAMYKHQWHVIRAIGQLRSRGHKVSLILAGGGTGPAQELIDKEIIRTDPERKFVTQVGFVKHEAIPSLLSEANIFVFASSCENMPNTLVEAMASGLPIACSDRGPMPEVLNDAGVYFDPENPASISQAIEEIIKDEEKRLILSKKAKLLSEQYSWARTSNQTFAFLAEIAITSNGK